MKTFEVCMNLERYNIDTYREIESNMPEFTKMVPPIIGDGPAKLHMVIKCAHLGLMPPIAHRKLGEYLQEKMADAIVEIA